MTNTNQPVQEKGETLRHPPPSKLMIGIFTILLLGALYIARTFLLPVFSALFLAYALLPIVRGLVHLHIPRMIGAALAVVVTFVGLIALFMFLTEPALDLLERIPRSLDKVKELYQVVDGPMSRVSRATEEIEEMTKSKGSESDLEVRVKEDKIEETILDQTPVFIGAVLSVFLLVYFILAFGETILGKIVEASPDWSHKRAAVTIARTVQKSVSRYLITVTIINAGLGFVVGGLLYLLEYDNVFFWGAIAALFNYIPYLGAMAGVGLLAASSLISGSTIEEILLYPTVYLLCTLIEGNFVTPLILGRTFSINPVFIILGLLFLGWLWGVVGAVLAVPILIAVKMAADTSKSAKGVAIILGR